MRLLMVAALIMSAMAFDAASQQPAPTPSKAGQAQQNKGGAANQAAQTDKREATQPPIVVNVVQPPETKEEQNEKRKERDENATFQRWNTISTIVIALFTIVLAVTTIAQWNAARQSGNAAWKAANVAERGLIDLERPYIFLDLRELVFQNLVRTAGGNSSINFSRTRMPLKYGLINRGRTPAFLTELHQRLVVGSMPAPIDTIDPDLEGVVSLKGQDVGAGESHPRTVELNTSDVTAIESLDRMYLIGFIRYTDIFHRKHITGFCAKFSIVENRFALIGGEQYNYTKDDETTGLS